MDFEIDNDDDYNFDYLDSSNISNLSSPKYPQSSSRSPLAGNSYYMPKKDKSPVNKNVKSTSSLSYFPGRSDEDDNPYDFDLTETNRGSTSKLKGSYTGTSKSKDYSSTSASGTGTVASKMKESMTFSTMSSLDKAQSILSKYGQGNNKVTASNSSFKRATEVFDEDDISIGSADEYDDYDDAGDVVGNFTSSVYGTKKSTTAYCAPTTSTYGKGSKVIVKEKSQFEDSNDDFSMEQSTSPGMSPISVKSPIVANNYGAKLSYVETSMKPNPKSTSPKYTGPKSKFNAAESINDSQEIEEEFYQSDIIEEASRSYNHNDSQVKEDYEDNYDDDDSYDDEDDYIPTSAPIISSANKSVIVDNDMDDEPYKPKIMSFEDLAGESSSEDNARHNEYDEESFDELTGKIAIGINSVDVLDDSGYSSPRSIPSPKHSKQINTSKPAHVPLAVDTTMPVSSAKVTKPASPLISIVSAAIQGHGYDMLAPKPSTSVELKDVNTNVPAGSSHKHHDLKEKKNITETAGAAHFPVPSPLMQQHQTSSSSNPQSYSSTSMPNSPVQHSSTYPQVASNTQPTSYPQPNHSNVPPSYPPTQQLQSSPTSTEPYPPAGHMNMPPYPYQYHPYHPMPPPPIPPGASYPYPSYPMPPSSYYPYPYPTTYSYPPLPYPMQAPPYPYAWPQPQHSYPPQNIGLPQQQQPSYNPVASSSTHSLPGLYTSSSRQLPHAKLGSKLSNPLLSSLLSLQRQSRDSLLNPSSDHIDGSASNDSVLLELLKELKEAKQDAADARYKLAEVLAVVTKNQTLNEMLASNSTATASTTSLPTTKQTPTSAKPSQYMRYDDNEDEEEEVKDEEDDDEYSNDFEVSQSNIAYPQAKTLRSVPSHRSIETNTDLTPDDDIALNLDFSKPLLMSQALYRNQLDSLKQRLQAFAPHRHDDIENEPITTSSPTLAYSTTSSLTDIKIQFDRRRQENVDKFVQLLREIDPNINDNQGKSMVQLYLA